MLLCVDPHWIYGEAEFAARRGHSTQAQGLEWLCGNLPVVSRVLGMLPSLGELYLGHESICFSEHLQYDLSSVGGSSQLLTRSFSMVLGSSLLLPC